MTELRLSRFLLKMQVSIIKRLIYNDCLMLNWLHRLFVPPIFADEVKTRASQFMIIFSWVAIGVVFLLIITRFVRQSDAGIYPVLILASIIPLLLFMQFIVKLGYVNVASIFVIFSVWGVLTYLALNASGIRDAALLAYIVVIMLSSLLLGWRFASVMGGLSVVAIWYFAIMEKQGTRILRVDDPISYARDLSAIIILIGVLIYLLISSWSRTLQSARVELQERLRAEEKLQRQANYLTALNETALGLLNRSELQPLLESILARACDLLNTKHALIELVLPDGSALRQEVAQGIISEYNGTLAMKNEGMAGTVWASGETLVVQDYVTWDKRLPETIEAGVTAVMGVPLKAGNTIIGVLAIPFVEQGRIFTQEQISLMEQFAALASLAIDNARLFEQAQKEIHERSLVEIELRASEERFRKVFHASPVAIIISSLDDGHVVEANNAYWKLTGFDPQESVGQTALELGIWDSEGERKNFVDRIKQEHSLYDPEYQFFNRAGESTSTLAFHELVNLGGMDSVLSMFYDITDQKKARESLQNSEARTRAVLASIPDMIFEISKDGIFLDFMASAEIAPLMPPEQFLGRNIKDMFPPVIVDQTFFALERALATGQLHAFEYGLPPGEEIQFFEARIMSITSESALMMVRDISQRKYVQTEREKLINELEDKNSELERFTYTVSHDLKSPLITIKGFLGFLEQDAASGNVVRLKADIQRIASAADKMQMLLNELLTLSRIGRVMNPYQNIKFEEIAREAVELVQGQIQSAGIYVSIQENLPAVYGDRQRLVEVIQNLVDNAAKFMGEQTHPRIEIGLHGYKDEKPIFYVKDNGIGIELIHHDRIFGLFNKLDANSDGTGIGLALVKRIIEVHGGRIWVQSEVGNGATFFFTLQTEPAS
jgi:PAS domain S-box-containing protein